MDGGSGPWGRCGDHHRTWPRSTRLYSGRPGFCSQKAAMKVVRLSRRRATAHKSNSSQKQQQRRGGEAARRAARRRPSKTPHGLRATAFGLPSWGLRAQGVHGRTGPRRTAPARPRGGRSAAASRQSTPCNTHTHTHTHKSPVRVVCQRPPPTASANAALGRARWCPKGKVVPQGHAPRAKVNAPAGWCAARPASPLCSPALRTSTAHGFGFLGSQPFVPSTTPPTIAVAGP